MSIVEGIGAFLFGVPALAAVGAWLPYGKRYALAIVVQCGLWGLAVRGIFRALESNELDEELCGFAYLTACWWGFWFVLVHGVKAMRFHTRTRRHRTRADGGLPNPQ